MHPLDTDGLVELKKTYGIGYCNIPNAARMFAPKKSDHGQRDHSVEGTRRG